MGTLATTAFVSRYMYQRKNQRSPGQLLSGQDMILRKNHVADWIYIPQRKQAQIDKDVIHENTTRIGYNYKVGDQVMIRNRSAYRHKTPFKALSEILQTWTNRSSNGKIKYLPH